ncbi:MAG: hypothetical protein K9N10_22805 [Deltaproteobacteria bacterium]|nr:hypothetical protein [Deltaproteobacteria bacterium]
MSERKNNGTDHRLELDEEHTKELSKYTEMQLRYMLNRLVFPEASHAHCAASAGYVAGHAHVRASEIERKPQVRAMLTRCNHILHDAEIQTEEMSMADLIAFHEGVIRDRKTTTREKQASSQQLSELRGWIKNKQPQKVEKGSLAQFMEEHVYGRTTGLPSQRGIFDPESSAAEAAAGLPSIAGLSNPIVR